MKLYVYTALKCVIILVFFYYLSLKKCLICWLYPNEYIFDTQLENLRQATNGYAPQNIRFFTYSKLMLIIPDAGLEHSGLHWAGKSIIIDGDYGVPVSDYTDENVSAKVMKIIQSCTGIVNRMVWRKY